MTPDEVEQYWYFTFGYGHSPGINYYAKFYGTRGSSRERMVGAYGDKWSFQYKDAESAGVDRFNLKEVTVIGLKEKV